MIEFTVPGRPKAKQRPRKGKGGHFYTPVETAAYQERVAWVALRAMTAANASKVRCPVGVEIDLYFKDKRLPDIDNCAKAILDGMLNVVYEDDRQVRELKVARHQDKWERAEVVVAIKEGRGW